MNKVLEINGQKVSVMVRGTGNSRPVFLLHGWGGTKESWETLLWETEKSGIWEQRLAFAIDFPGFGGSDEPVQAWSVANYAHFLEQIIQKIYQEWNLSGNYDVIVHSFGGRVLFKLLTPDFAHNISERPEKLVLIASAGIKPTKTLRISLAGLMAKYGKKVMSLPGLRRLSPLAQKALYKILKSHDYEKSSGVMRDTLIKVLDEDLSESIAHIKNPALIFWGKKDSYIPLRDAYVIKKSIIGSHLITIADGKHGIHKTHAEILAPRIVEFLK
jgi:pimeloyl-ACP methyl ester carboxylesterase